MRAEAGERRGQVAAPGGTLPKSQELPANRFPA